MIQGFEIMVVQKGAPNEQLRDKAVERIPIIWKLQVHFSIHAEKENYNLDD